MELKLIGKFLITFGILMIAAGLILSMNIKLASWIGRLPGDILIQRKNFSLYFPLTTCLLASLLLTILFWLFGKK